MSELECPHCGKMIAIEFRLGNAEREGHFVGKAGATPKSVDTKVALTANDNSPVIHFGKHKGLSARQVLEQHPDYVTWLLKQPDFAERNENLARWWDEARVHRTFKDPNLDTYQYEPMDDEIPF